MKQERVMDYQTFQCCTGEPTYLHNNNNHSHYDSIFIQHCLQMSSKKSLIPQLYNCRAPQHEASNSVALSDCVCMYICPSRMWVRSRYWIAHACCMRKSVYQPFMPGTWPRLLSQRALQLSKRVAAKISMYIKLMKEVPRDVLPLHFIICTYMPVNIKRLWIQLERLR